MASLFIRLIGNQMRKGKDHIFNFNDPEALKRFRETLQKMFSIMKRTQSVSIEQLHMGNIPAEKHTNKTLNDPAPLIMLHLHEGGYFSGTAEMYRSFVSHLCKKLNVHAYSIDYRLVPEYPYPAALDDAFAAYKWMLEDEAVPPERLFILGDSAGGGLTMALLHRIKHRSMPQPKFAIAISPWTDLSFSNESYTTNREKDAFFNFANLEESARLYIGKDSAENPEISPIFGEFSGFPPVFLQVGSTEMLLHDSTILAEKLKKQGVMVEVDVWEGLFHDFPIFSRIPIIGKLTPEFKQAMNNMKHFIDNI